MYSLLDVFHNTLVIGLDLNVNSAHALDLHVHEDLNTAYIMVPCTDNLLANFLDDLDAEVQGKDSEVYDAVDLGPCEGLREL